MPVDQGLKTRIVSQRVPYRVYSQTVHSDVAWPIQESVQNFNRPIVVAKNGEDPGHTFRNLGTVKRVFAFGLQFARTLRFRQRGIFLAKKRERFCQLDA